MFVEIEGQAPFTATRGSIVNIPRQTIYSLETIGDRPSLRFLVNVTRAKTLFPRETTEAPAQPAPAGSSWGVFGENDELGCLNFLTPECLVEAAKLAPRQDHDLALVYETEKQKGNANRATLAVARKMVAYLLAVDRRARDFVPAENYQRAAA